MRNFLILLLSFIFIIGSQTATAKVTANYTITGKVATSADVGIPDVVVSDGITVTKTNASGQYTLNSNDKAKFVFISIPADCKIPHTGNVPKFYKDLRGNTKNVTANFTLEKQAKDNFFVLTSMADPQPSTAADLKRFQEEAIPDMAALKNYYPANTAIVGTSAGDIAWDNASLYPSISSSLSKLTYPYFQVIGNHDHDETVKNNDYKASHKFEDAFGPVYYSYNRGDCHIIALDNIVYRARTDYDEQITQEQLTWVQRDLAHVPKDKFIVIAMHSPGYTNTTTAKTSNIASLVSLLNGYKAIFISGHVHRMRKVVLSNNLTEYTLAPMMGYKWSGDIHTNGCPMGYGVFEFTGNQLTNYYYMSTKRDPDYQMNLFPVGAISDYPNSMAAHVWNHGTGWTVQVYEAGVLKGNMTKVSTIIPTANDHYLGSTLPVRDPNLEPTNSPFVFLYTPTNKNVEIKVVAKDPFGNEYVDYLNKTPANSESRQVIFAESGGQGADPAVGVTTWKNWQNTALTFNAGGCPEIPDLRNTYESSDVTRSKTTATASGANNIYFKAETPTGKMRGFGVYGIDASGFRDLEISFNYNKQKTGVKGLIDVYFWNGFKWVQVDSHLKEKTQAAGWYRSPNIKLPPEAEVSSLRLRFVKPAYTDGSIRLDDIYLTGIPKMLNAPSMKSATKLSNDNFILSWDAYPGATKFLLDVSKNADFVSSSSLTTLAAWTFPSPYVRGTLAKPDIASANNVNKYLSSTASGNATETAIYPAGGAYGNATNPPAVSSTGWHDGAYHKHFQIDIDATGFSQLTLSSWSYSSAAGPKEMRVQYRIAANTPWIDVPNSKLTMPQAAYGATSKLEGLALPDACNNQKNLSIRWVMTSTLRTSDVDPYIVGAGGTSRVSNIYIKGKPDGCISGYRGLSTTGTTHTLTNLDANTTYYARIQASDGKNISKVSNKLTFNTGELEPVVVDYEIDFKEQWNYSQISGHTANWITNGAQVTQDMAYHDGKLYVLHRSADNTSKIYIVNAFTGTMIGELNTTACTSGIYYLSSIGVIGGKVVACNLEVTAGNSLVVYKWDNDNTAATKWLTTSSRDDIARVGDKISISGDLTNGKIWFGFGDKVYYYKVTNNTIAATPTVINLTKGGVAFNVGALATVGVQELTDGSIWVSGKDMRPARFNASGVWQEEISTSLLNAQHGTDFNTFNFGDKKYAVAADYFNISQPVDKLSEGTFALLNVTNGIASATHVKHLPANGLGASRNASFRSKSIVHVDGNDVHLWVHMPTQGAAYYHYNAVVTEIENSTIQEHKIYVGYNMLFIQGIEVADINVFTLTGQLVKSAQAVNELMIDDLKGMYVVLVKDVNNQVYTQKVIIR